MRDHFQVDPAKVSRRQRTLNLERKMWEANARHDETER